MQRPAEPFTLDREMIMADALREVASELRLIDPTDLAAFIRTGQFGNIAHLVNASTELFFHAGAIRFARSGDVHLSWTHPPRISLDLEFRESRVNVFFRLHLEGAVAGIEIDYIHFANLAPDPDENTRCLADALAGRRLLGS